MTRKDKQPPSRNLWKDKRIELEVVKTIVEKFQRLSLYSLEWKGGYLYLVQKGVKDNIAPPFTGKGRDIACRGEWKVARFKPQAKNTDDWKVFWYDSSGRWKWEPLYGEGTLEECLKIVSQNEMGLFLG